MIPVQGYAGQTVAVLGLGRSGRTAAAALREGGADVVVWDDGQAGREAAEADGFALRDLTKVQSYEGVAALIVSPGIALEDPLVVRARAADPRLRAFLSQPFFVAAAFSGMEGRSVPIKDTIAGCRAILNGECDDWEESALYMVGDLEEARQKQAAGRKKAGAA